MPRTEKVQLNIRSAFARRRAHELASRTGMSVSQVVEDALRAYAPIEPRARPGLVQKGPLLVLPAAGRRVSLEEAEEALAATREAQR